MAATRPGISSGGTSPTNWKWAFQAGRANLPFELLPQNAVADQEKSHQRLGADQALRRFDQVLVALEVEQSGDLANNHVLGPIAQLVPHGIAKPMRLKQRFDLDAAIDRRELLPRGHAGG